MINKWLSWNVIDSTKYFGFVYKITNLKTGKFYIAEQTGPGRKPVYEVIRTESDWQKYWGSNKQLLADVKEYGEENFDRWILTQCKTKKQLTYWEMHHQCKEEVLIGTHRSYNDNILGKFFTKDLEA